MSIDDIAFKWTQAHYKDERKILGFAMTYTWSAPQASSTALGIAISGIPTPALVIQDGPHRLTSTAALALDAMAASAAAADGPVALPMDTLGIAKGLIPLDGQSLVGLPSSEQK